MAPYREIRGGKPVGVRSVERGTDTVRMRRHVRARQARSSAVMRGALVNGGKLVRGSKHSETASSETACKHHVPSCVVLAEIGKRGAMFNPTSAPREE